MIRLMKSNVSLHFSHVAVEALFWILELEPALKASFAGNNAVLCTMEVDIVWVILAAPHSRHLSVRHRLPYCAQGSAVIRNFMDAKCNNFVVKSISLLSIAHDFLFKKPTAVACYRFHTEQTPHLCSYSNLHFVLQPPFTPNMPIAR